MKQSMRIFSYISRLTLISLLVLLPVVAAAQKSKDAEQQTDSVPLFGGIAVSGDLIGIAQRAFSSYGQYEAAVRINLKDKYFPIIELGIGEANAQDYGTNITYKTRAPYGRIGIDINLLKNKHDIYRLYGGVRYAYTSFKYDISAPPFADPIWGNDVVFEGKDVQSSYQWGELVLGVDAKIWGPFKLGWSVRYRHKIVGKAADIGEAWYVPGYGKSGTTAFGGTFNVIIEL